MEDDERFVHAAAERVAEHLGQHLAVSLVHRAQQHIHALPIGHIVRFADGIEVPHSAPRPAGRNLALAFAAGPDKPVSQNPVALAAVACMTEMDAAPMSCDGVLIGQIAWR